MAGSIASNPTAGFSSPSRIYADEKLSNPSECHASPRGRRRTLFMPLSSPLLLPRACLSSGGEEVNNGNSLNRRAMAAFIALASAHTSSSAFAATLQGPLKESAQQEREAGVITPSTTNNGSSISFAEPNLSATVASVEVLSRVEPNQGILVFITNLLSIGSVIIGGLYWLEQRVANLSKSALEEARAKLKGREDALCLLKESEINVLAEKEQVLLDCAEAMKTKSVLVTELASCKQREESLREELLSVKSSLQSLPKVLKGLEMTMIERKQQIEVLEAKLSEEQSRGKLLEDEIKVSQAWISDKKAEAGHAELLCTRSNIEDLESEIALVSKCLKEREAEVHDIHVSLALARAEGEEIERQVTKARKELDDGKVLSEREIQKLKSNLASKDYEMQQLSIKLSAVLKEREQTSKLIENSIEEIDSLNQKLSEENSIAEMVTEELARNASSLKEVSTLNRELRSLEKTYAKLKQDLSYSQEELVGISATLQKEREQTAAMMELLECSRQSVIEAKRTIKMLREDVVKAKVEVEKTDKEVLSRSKEFEAINIRLTALEAKKMALNKSMSEEKEELSGNSMENARQVDVFSTKMRKKAAITLPKRAKKLEVKRTLEKVEMTTMDSSLENAESRAELIAENSQSVEEISSVVEPLCEIEILQGEPSMVRKDLVGTEADMKAF